MQGHKQSSIISSDFNNRVSIETCIPNKNLEVLGRQQSQVASCAHV